MTKATSIMMLAAMCLLSACDRPWSNAEKGAAAGSAIGTGIGLVTGSSFGTVVGAGLIGGAVGYLGGTAIDNNK
ncbi:MAG TPA: hypothetical protein VJQ81_04690 [Reyranella sp.]|jgi:hypothetical protein|nr:hypothetical protein [Reyranella sp.]